MIIHERIGEVNEIPENHGNGMTHIRQSSTDPSLFRCSPCPCHLEVRVDTATSFVDTFKAKFAKPKVGNVGGDAVGGVQKKRILKDISADFPAGTLTKIIGGSGSRKSPSP